MLVFAGANETQTGYALDIHYFCNWKALGGGGSGGSCRRGVHAKYAQLAFSRRLNTHSLCSRENHLGSRSKQRTKGSSATKL